jgi:predicted amidohydrolase YtcJ
MIAQTVVLAQRVLPMSSNTPTLGGPGGLAIADGRILMVGTRAEVEATVESGTRVLEFPSATVLPGLIDSHVHFTSLGMNLLGPSVADCETIADVLERVADVVRTVPAGDGLLLHGFSMAELEPRLTSADLDRVAPNHPVLLIDQGGHGSVINSRGADAIQLDLAGPGVRRCQSGERSGELVDEANMFARRRFEGYVTDDQRHEAHRLAAAHAVSVGLTTLHALQQVERIEALIDQAQELSVRTVIYPQTTDVERVLAWGLPRLGGCLLVDGTYLQRTTALLEPYVGESNERGTLYFSDESLTRVFETAHRVGLQIAVHAIGDAAIGQALRAYARVLADDPRPDHRHRIEHFSLPLPEHIDQAAELGLALGMQPIFANQQTVDAVAALVGPHRIKRRHPYRRILDSGLLVGGGSDADAMPLNPLLGIHEVVNHPEAERRVSVLEALQLFTLNAAKLGFEETSKGSLEVGKLADLTLLDADPLAADPRTLRDFKTLATVVGGEVRYTYDGV